LVIASNDCVLSAMLGNLYRLGLQEMVRLMEWNEINGRDFGHNLFQSLTRIWSIQADGRILNFRTSYTFIRRSWVTQSKWFRLLARRKRTFSCLLFKLEWATNHVGLASIFTWTTANSRLRLRCLHLQGLLQWRVDSSEVLYPIYHTTRDHRLEHGKLIFTAVRTNNLPHSAVRSEANIWTETVEQ
jgi:hypothetical protein